MTNEHAANDAMMALFFFFFVFYFVRSCRKGAYNDDNTT